MGDFISVSGWDEMQHYKDRTPPWIKLHNELLENYEFECLPDASKAHLLCIWLLASRTDNKINPDPKWIGRKIGANSKLDIDILIKSGFLQLNQQLQGVGQDASKMLQGVGQDACTEREREGEGEQSRGKPDARKTFKEPTAQEVKDYAIEKKLNLKGFHDYYESNGWRVGKNKMKNWRAAASGWSKRQGEFNQPTVNQQTTIKKVAI